MVRQAHHGRLGARFRGLFRDSLEPAVAALTVKRPREYGLNRVVHQEWKSFWDEALEALQARFGRAAKSGRRILKVPKGGIPADSALVVMVSQGEGVGFNLADERRWVVSSPQQHQFRRSTKELAANSRGESTIRMLKAARNQLVKKESCSSRTMPPSYLIECLLFNAPDGLLAPWLAPIYTGIIDWLKGAQELVRPFQERWDAGD